MHALSVLLTDSRANRTRLRAAAGGVPALADVLGDAQLDWEAKEEAAALLEDLASTLLLVRWGRGLHDSRRVVLAGGVAPGVVALLPVCKRLASSVVPMGLR